MLAGAVPEANKVLASIREFRSLYVKSEALLPSQQLTIPVPLNLNWLTPLNNEVELVGGSNVDRCGFQAAHQNRWLQHFQRNRLALLDAEVVRNHHMVIPGIR